MQRRSFQYKITDFMKSSYLGLFVYILIRNFLHVFSRLQRERRFKPDLVRFGIPDNSLYGINRHIELSSNFRNFIEHGPFLGDYIHNVAMGKNINAIYCIGAERKKYLQNVFADKEVVNIGCLMSHVKDTIPPLGDEINVDYVLLVLTHSTATLKVKSDYGWVRTVVSAFSEVVVLLYYLDWERAEYFRSLGCKVVCNGHKYDRNFLNRLKYVLKSARIVITDNIGSHLGYAIMVKTPVLYVESNFEFKAISLEGINQLEKENTVARESIVRELKTAFYSDLSSIKQNKEFKITQRQLNLVKKWWS